VYFEYICSTFARCLLDRANGVQSSSKANLEVKITTTKVTKLRSA